MTIKQAIARLHNLQSMEEFDLCTFLGVYYQGIKDDYDDALKMAIEALSELDNNSTKVDNENVDLITKQSALDFIHKTIFGFFDIADDESEEPISEKDELLLEVNKAICNGIKELQSAQTERKKGEWILAEDGWYCSVCELYPPFDCDPEEKGIPYCPHCGADMRKPKLQYGDADTLQDGIKDLPERKKGEWIVIWDKETDSSDSAICSVCEMHSVRPLGRFCKWCGSDMRGKEDGTP